MQRPIVRDQTTDATRVEMTS